MSQAWPAALLAVPPDAVVQSVAVTEQRAQEDEDPRPRVTGWFVDPEDIAVPLLVAIGRFVFTAAGLEKALQLELVRLLWVSLGSNTDEPNILFAKETASLQRLSAGALLARLRACTLSTELHDRVDDAIKRRNALVHHAFEDQELMTAATGGGPPDAVIERVNQLATECAELTVELVAYAISKIEELFETPRADLYEMVLSMDPNTITDAADKKLLEAVQAFHDPESIVAVLNELILPPRASPSEPADDVINKQE